MQNIDQLQYNTFIQQVLTVLVFPETKTIKKNRKRKNTTSVEVVKVNLIKVLSFNK